MKRTRHFLATTEEKQICNKILDCAACVYATTTNVAVGFRRRRKQKQIRELPFSTSCLIKQTKHTVGTALHVPSNLEAARVAAPYQSV